MLFCFFLQITLERVLPYWETVIAPSVKSGKRVVVAAHGNSLRALGKENRLMILWRVCFILSYISLPHITYHAIRYCSVPCKSTLFHTPCDDLISHAIAQHNITHVVTHIMSCYTTAYHTYFSIPCYIYTDVLHITCHTTLYYTRLHYTALHCTALYNTATQCNATHCTTLHCTT